MRDKSRKLLERALEALEWEYGGEPLGSLTHQSIQDIRVYLAEPEKKQEPFSVMRRACPYTTDTLRGAFYDGWLKAEKHHGIGGEG